jgi:hypothetical protein
VRWWGLYQGSNIPLEPDVFTIRIFADNAGVPASTPLVELRIERVHRRATELVSAGYDVYEYTALLKPHVTLPAGTYWLSILNDVDTEEVGTDWLWALNNNDAGNFAARVQRECRLAIAALLRAGVSDQRNGAREEEVICRGG